MNEALFFWFYSLAQAGPVATRFVFWAAEYMPLTIMGILGGLWLFARVQDRRHFFSLLILSAVSGVGAWLAAHFLKVLFPASRPFVLLSGVTPLVTGTEASSTFPSGHASFLFGAAIFSFYWLRRPAGYTLLALALIGGLARVAAGVHWPVDIIGGIIVGSGIAIIVQRLAKRYQLIPLAVPSPPAKKNQSQKPVP